MSILGVGKTGKDKVGNAVKVYHFSVHWIVQFGSEIPGRQRYRLGTGTSTGHGFTGYDPTYDLLVCSLYGMLKNEVEVGEAVKSSDLARDKIWLTSKASICPVA